MDTILYLFQLIADLYLIYIGAVVLLGVEAAIWLAVKVIEYLDRSNGDID